VQRLRLERAAYLLAITDQSVLEVGLAVGFRSHESFSRAFKRGLGRTPTAYRQAAKAAQRERLERNRTFRGDGCVLSDVRFETRAATPMLAIRRVGAYSGFDAASREAIWRELIDWAEQRGVAYSTVRLGFFPDDPGMTPLPLQQADLCIPIAAPVAGTERVRCIEFVGGRYAVVDHFGPYETVSQAYRNLADGVRGSPDYVFGEAAPMQVFRQIHVGGDPAANHSEVCFPVRRRG
jgi:AraC family transcriptional regulator